MNATIERLARIAPPFDHKGAGWRVTPWAPCPKCGEHKPVSPSEINKARGCLRAHAFAYCSDTPQAPAKPAAATGTELHGHAENYLRDGTAPPETGTGQLFRAGLPHLPPPGVGAVEAKIRTVIEGIPFEGFIDWLGYYADAAHVPGFRGTVDAIVLDHKTSSDPKRYGIWSLPERLDDPQTLIYGYATGVQRVGFRWLYYPTKGRRRVKPSDQVLTRSELRGGIDRVVLPVARHAWANRRQVDPNTVECNAGHCHAYGGCEYHPRAGGSCAVNDRDVSGAVFSGAFDTGKDRNMGLIDDLRKSTAAAPAAPDGINGATAPAPDPAPATPAAAPAFNFAPAATQGAAAPTPPEPTPAAAPAPTAAPAPGADPLTRVGHALIAAGRVLVG